MNQAISYWLELLGVTLTLAWIFANPTSFNNLTTAASTVSVGSVRALQGR